ncbi:MAG: ROK family protein [Anaerolineaceae bacterium]|nr:MAG: ROK family protein [Anaerolineaceae bacterium]
MSQFIAVDLGGTNIRVAYFPKAELPPLTQSKTPTLAPEGPDAVIERMCQAIEEQLPTDRSDLSIGIGAPGPLDPRHGMVLKAVNLPGWEMIPLKSILEQRFVCPVHVGNDANLAALGEWRFGAGQGTNDLIYLTISTGIGGGVIIDGRLLVGSWGLGAELGHMTVDPDGPICSCGRPGHLEAVASGPAIARRATARIEAGETSSLTEQLKASGSLTAVDVGDAAQAGDPMAREVIEEAAEYIGRHMADLAHAFNPEIFVIGGGVSQLGPLLFEPIERAVEANVMTLAYMMNVQIAPAALGDDAGLIGAMVLASQE